jgi:hypothetical protein
MRHNYFNIPGWFNMHEAYDQLLNICEDDDIIVEIGSFMGRSTSYLATNVVNSQKKIKIFCVDTFEGSTEHGALNIPQDFYQEFEKNVQPFIDNGYVIPLQGRSDDPQIINFFADKSLKGIIVDGAHEYDAVKEDIINWWPKLKDDGYMVGDDIMLPAVREASKDAMKHLKIDSLTYLTGQEQWFLATPEKESKIKKLVPGVNCLK